MLATCLCSDSNAYVFLGYFWLHRKLLPVTRTSLSSVIPGMWSLSSSLCLFTQYQIGLIPHCSIIAWFLTGSTLVLWQFSLIFSLLESPGSASSGLRGVGVQLIGLRTSHLVDHSICCVKSWQLNRMMAILDENSLGFFPSTKPNVHSTILRTKVPWVVTNA